MSKKIYCTDANGVARARGPAIDWDKFQVIPAGGHDEDHEKRHRAAVDHLEKLCTDAKIDRAVELLHQITAQRNKSIPDAGPSVGELRPSAVQQMASICAESEAAYAARNPHTREGNNND